MDSDGLTNTPLVKVTEVDIYKETVTAGVFSDAICGGVTCVNKYAADGSILAPVRRNPPCTPESSVTQPDYRNWSSTSSTRC